MSAFLCVYLFFPSGELPLMPHNVGSAKRVYAIVDTRGHRDFIMNMITACLNTTTLTAGKKTSLAPKLYCVYSSHCISRFYKQCQVCQHYCTKNKSQWSAKSQTATQSWWCVKGGLLVTVNTGYGLNWLQSCNWSCKSLWSWRSPWFIFLVWWGLQGCTTHECSTKMKSVMYLATNEFCSLKLEDSSALGTMCIIYWLQCCVNGLL